VETQRVQYKKLQREFDECSGTEAVHPNKRLNQERLAKLQTIGFAWSAKGQRKNPTSTDMKARRPSLVDVRSLARLRLNDAQWQQMYEKLVMYKEEHGVCSVI
jgi:hypothetical protein